MKGKGRLKPTWFDGLGDEAPALRLRSVRQGRAEVVDGHVRRVDPALFAPLGVGVVRRTRDDPRARLRRRLVQGEPAEGAGEIFVVPWGGLYVVLDPEPSVHVLLDEEVSEWLDGHRAAGPRARAHRGQVRRRSSNTRRHGLCVDSVVVPRFVRLKIAQLRKVRRRQRISLVTVYLRGD